MLGLDARTGAIVWQTYSIDDSAYAAGYRGNAIWGSQPAVDVKRKAVYVATGNNYDVPETVAERGGDEGREARRRRSSRVTPPSGS